MVFTFSLHLLLAGRVNQWVMNFATLSQTSIALSPNCLSSVHLVEQNLNCQKLKPRQVNDCDFSILE